MRPSMDVPTVLGTLAVLVTLSLSGPGVSVVRASDDALVSRDVVTPLPEDGPTCSAGAPADAVPAELQAIMERARLEALADAGNQSGPHGIVLNNRGYNYGPAPTLNPATLDAERRGY